MTGPLLSVEDLVVEFRQRGWRKPPFRAVDGVSFAVGAGETVGLVGESGSGKSTIGRAILGLTTAAAGRITFDGQDVTHRTKAQQRELARSLSAVFQDPYGSLNPMRPVGLSIVEPLEAVHEVSSDTARAHGLLSAVRLDPNMADRLPHRFSGGQRQRIAIARGMSVDPKLIICDEAVSALDVVTRAQILDLLADLRDDTNAALLFVGHDLPVVGYLASRIVVLYRGRVMEQGDAQRLLDEPLHPYTQALLAAVPVIDPSEQRRRRQLRRDATSESTANAAHAPDGGCPFAPRCPHSEDVCWQRRPATVAVQERRLECHMFDASSGHSRTVAAGRRVASGEDAATVAGGAVAQPPSA